MRKIIRKKISKNIWLILIGTILLLIIINFPFLLLILVLFLIFFFRRGKRKEDELKKICRDFYQGQKFVAIDLETTGLNPRKDEIIEIAAIKFDKNGKGDSFVKFIRPRGYVPFEIQEMLGIPISKIMEEGKPFREIQGEFISFVGNSPILGWNLSFDLDFLRNNGIELLNPTIDVMKLAQDLLPSEIYKKGRRRRVRRRFYLLSIARDLGIYIRDIQRAGSHAFLCGKIFEKLMEQLKYKYFRENI